MNIDFHEYTIENKSSEQKDGWQNHFYDSNFYITENINGISVLFSYWFR